MSEIIISESYNKAVTLHRRICANAQAAQESLWEVCKGLKEMRDEKLYTEIGCKSFKEYCEKELELTDRQARNYIVIAENFSEEERKSISAFSSTKLLLLAKLDEPERTEITQNTDIEKVSVRELKTKIADLKKANDRLMSKVEEAEKKAETSRKSEEKACGRASILETDNESYKKKIEELESQVEELENRPIEIAVQESHEVENMRKAMEKLNEDIARQDAEIQAEHEERIRSLRQTHAQEIESLKKEYEQKLHEVPKQEQISDQKEVFKAYLSIAVDASKRLTEFVKSSPDDFFKAKTKELFTKLLQEVEYETI